MRILIVEDERRLAEALGQIMAEQRYQADVVFDRAVRRHRARCDASQGGRL